MMAKNFYEQNEMIVGIIRIQNEESPHVIIKPTL